MYKEEFSGDGATASYYIRYYPGSGKSEIVRYSQHGLPTETKPFDKSIIFGNDS